MFTALPPYIPAGYRSLAGKRLRYEVWAGVNSLHRCLYLAQIVARQAGDHVASYALSHVDWADNDKANRRTLRAVANKLDQRSAKGAKS